MNLIQRWWQRIDQQHTTDQTIEQQHGIRSTTTKQWVTPSDIEALEEEKVPWLREKRRQARRTTNK